MKKTGMIVFAFLSISSTYLLLFSGCKKDEGPSGGTTTPITGDLFPLVQGHRFVFVGYAIGVNGNPARLPDSNHVYQAIWNIGLTRNYPRIGTATMIVDSTTIPTPLGPLTAANSLFLRKDTSTGDFFFLQNLA